MKVYSYHHIIIFPVNIINKIINNNNKNGFITNNILGLVSKSRKGYKSLYKRKTNNKKITNDCICIWIGTKCKNNVIYYIIYF